MNFTAEVESGQRFEFGKNWQRFLATMNDQRVAEAKTALTAMLGDINGKTFLDVGCGSGLSSLAASMLGAKVYAFDYDPQSVACTKELQRMYGLSWPVEEGSALDSDYLSRLGKFDIVYSWGVLHHTGDMWKALENMIPLVKPGGLLFVALYNDQGWKSSMWHSIKGAYNRHPFVRFGLLATYAPLLTSARTAIRAIKRKKSERGMSIWHDTVDWLGGYPFEVAAPGAVTEFYLGHGLSARKTQLVGRKPGCNEFVFTK